MNSATAEYEQEIVALQADLGVVRSELDHWRSTAAKHEEEISRLQEAFTQQQQQQNTATQLQGERASCSQLSCSHPNTESHGKAQLTPDWISVSVECVELQQRCACLQQECDNLRGERTALSEKLQCLEAELNR